MYAYPLISDSVDGSKVELKKLIDKCRRELLEKYGSNEGLRRDVTKLSKTLTDVRSLFVLRNGGAYEQAIAYFIAHLKDPINAGQGNGDVLLGIFEQHYGELLTIERNFSENTDWDNLEVVMRDFYRRLNRSEDGSGHQGTDHPLN